MYCIRLIQNSSGISTTLFFRYTSAYSIVFSVIQAYSLILRHSLLRLIQAYSVALAYSQLCHILSPCIFRTGSLFKALWIVDQISSEPCHRASFSHVQAYSEPCATLVLCRNPTYSSSWNIHNSSIITSRNTFRILSHLRKFTNIENPDIFKTRHICRTLSKI